MKTTRTETGYCFSMTVGNREEAISINQRDNIPHGYWGRFYTKIQGVERGFDSLKSARDFAEQTLTDRLFPMEKPE